jgi:hypothetical protein
LGKLRVLSGKQVCDILAHHGFLEVRQRGSHIVMQKKLRDTTPFRFQITRSCVWEHYNRLFVNRVWQGVSLNRNSKYIPLSERSFAQSKRYGYKRARWRRLWKIKIQDFLIAAIQNVQILPRHSKRKSRAQANALATAFTACLNCYRPSFWSMLNLKLICGNQILFRTPYSS